MDRETIALILSITAMLLVTLKWLYDLIQVGSIRAPGQRRGPLSRRRVELLEGQTNCFITRGGYLLFLVSCRIYNDSDQNSLIIQNHKFQAKIGHKWRSAQPYSAPQAAIFPSLFRNSLPIKLEPEERQDFYEVFALDELIPSPQIGVRLTLEDTDQKTIKCQALFKHRVDERPIFDMLYRVLE